LHEFFDLFLNIDLFTWSADHDFDDMISDDKISDVEIDHLIIEQITYGENDRIVGMFICDADIFASSIDS